MSILLWLLLAPAPPATDPMKLTDAERESLAEALYISVLNCKVATDFLPFAQIIEERKEHWRREIGGVIPHIERILSARLAALDKLLREARLVEAEWWVRRFCDEHNCDLWSDEAKRLDVLRAKLSAAAQGENDAK